MFELSYLGFVIVVFGLRWFYGLIVRHESFIETNAFVEFMLRRRSLEENMLRLKTTVGRFVLFLVKVKLVHMILNSGHFLEFVNSIKSFLN